MKQNRKKYLYIILLCFVMLISINNVYAATEYVKCGESSFPKPLASMIRNAVLILQIAVPIGIIIMGSLDFLKATIASDQEAMKKNQKHFLSRLFAGVITFFVFVIVKFLVSVVSDSSATTSMIKCVDCLINNEGSCNTTAESPFKP